MTYFGFTNPVYEEWKKTQQNLSSSSPSKESRETFYYITNEIPSLKEKTEEEIIKDKEKEKTKLYKKLHDIYTMFVINNNLSVNDFFDTIMQVATDEFKRTKKEHADVVVLMSKFKDYNNDTDLLSDS